MAAAAVANPTTLVDSRTTTPSRPAFLSARTRTISYKRQNGNVVTLELTNSKAAESLRELAKKNPTTEQDKKFIDEVESGEPQGLVAGVYDALSIWIMDAIEIAMFGPYDEPK
jgi:hypothetical protein